MAVIEVVTFRLGPAADESQFLEADGRVQTEFHYHQPGFLRRTTARRGDDWLVLTVWGSGSDAEAAAEACRHHAAVARWATFLDRSSVVTTGYDTLD
jgi:hypothetical protein